MVRDRLAEIRARQAGGTNVVPPDPPRGGWQARYSSDPAQDMPSDFNPFSPAPVDGGGDRMASRVRDLPPLPPPSVRNDPYDSPRDEPTDFHPDYPSPPSSAHLAMPRSLSAGSVSGRGAYAARRFDDEPVPPVPSSSPPPREAAYTFGASPSWTGSAYLGSPPEAPLPRDFDPLENSPAHAPAFSPAYSPTARSPPAQQPLSMSPRDAPRPAAVVASAPAARRVPPVPVVGTVPYSTELRADAPPPDKASTIDLVQRDDSSGDEHHRGSTSTTKGAGPAYAAAMSHEEFYEQISDLQGALRDVNGRVQLIGDLHMRMLAMASSEDRRALEIKEQLEDAKAAARSQFQSLRDRVHSLEQANVNLRASILRGQSAHQLSLADTDVREEQLSGLKERVKAAIQRYGEVERDYRRNQRSRLERQVKVVNPDMTPDEVTEAVQVAESSGEGAMFTQALQSNGARLNSARGVLREVQNRAAELARIEATLIELAELFQDMSVLVEAQDDVIKEIEHNAVKTEVDMETGLVDVKQAVVHARNYRKYRWWCFGLIVVILAIIVIVVCVEVIPKATGSSGGKSQNNSAPAASPVVVTPVGSVTLLAAPTTAAPPTSTPSFSLVSSLASAAGASSSTNGTSLAAPTASAHNRLQYTMSHPSDGPFPRPVPSLPDSILARFSMKGKVTIVTGGSGGLGWAAAEGIAEAGGDLALQYRSAEGMDERAADLAKKYGTKVKAYKVDVAEYDAIKKLVDDVKQEFGRIDCFIANAGMGGSGRIGELDLDQWRRIQAVNYDAVFYAMKVLAPVFEAQGNGSFIATTSISARIVNVPLDQSAYNASKAAVVHLCKSVARDWRLFARVNTISPGFFDTAMGAAPEVADTVHRYSVLGRQGDPKELAGAFLYLASDASTYTTGHDMLVDGGYTLS
ncbi:hypothetical protein JCM3775_007104 [Rhodotorula graminis]